MFKYILFLFVNIFLVSIADANGVDTTVYYFKYNGYRNIQVSTLDSADYFRIVLPPDHGDKRNNIQEYYRNGKIKLISKASAAVVNNDPSNENIVLDGDCIAYYSNGSKERTLHYSQGYKEGDEFKYYPNGKIYCCIRHSVKGISQKSLFWECYDGKENMLCKDGNGQWLLYDVDGETLVASGAVKNGYQEGEWKGTSTRFDTISYIYKYKSGKLLSSIGYDKNGIAYPFDSEEEFAEYKYGVINFVQSVRNHIKWTSRADREDIDSDSLFVWFTVEKNGSLTHVDILDSIKPNVKEAILKAFDHQYQWGPYRYFGVPFKTEIGLPLKCLAEPNRYLYEVGFRFRGRISIKPIQASPLLPITKPPGQ